MKQKELTLKKAEKTEKTIKPGKCTCKGCNCGKMCSGDCESKFNKR